MTKCNLCDHRYREELEPACVTICPTGALKTGELEMDKNITVTSGFPTTVMKPAIEIIPLRMGQKLPESPRLPFDSNLLELYRTRLMAVTQKISLGSEWSLLLFTYLAAFLVGDTFAAVFSTGLLGPVQYCLLLVCTFGISLTHLGRKSRAIRAVLNWRNSWLSREIILFGLFAVISIASRFFPAGSAITGPLAAIVGVAALFVMDHVYGILPLTDRSGIRDRALLLTGLMFTVILLDFIPVVLPIIGLKVWLFISNYRISMQQRKSIYLYALAAGRILSGFILLPVALFIHLFPSDKIVLLLISELLDRMIFYISLAVISPEIQMEQDFRNNL
jgi:DMSO reductase anchor subunit